MRSQPVVTICLVLLGAGGCRTDPAIMMLERENRQLEDVIYRQRDTIDQYRQALEACQASAPAIVEGPSLGPPQPTPAPRPTRSPTEPRSRRRQSSESSAPEIPGPPVIEMPEQAEPPGELPEIFRSPRSKPGPEGEAPPFERSPGTNGPARTPARGAATRSPWGARDEVAAGGNTPVAQITLANVVVRRGDTSQSPGGEGISLVVQPRDAAGRVVQAAAPLSIVVLDPAVSGEAARVARWDISANEVARLFRNSPAGDGIHLDLAWPAGPPVHNRLHLFARYATDDGRRVQTDQLIDVGVSAVDGPEWEPAGPNEPVTGGDRTAAEPDRLPATPTARAPVTCPLRTAVTPPRTPTLAPSQAPEWSPDRQ